MAASLSSSSRLEEKRAMLRRVRKRGLRTSVAMVLSWDSESCRKVSSCSEEWRVEYYQRK